MVSDAGGLRLCMDALSFYAYPYACLTAISIDSRRFSYDKEDLAIASQIAPLLRLPRLRQVELLLPNQVFYLTDAHLLKIGKCWPEIVCLKISCQTNKTGRRRAPKLYTVQRLICLCPHLCVLELPAVNILDIVDDPPARPEHGRSLRSFHVCRVLPPDLSSRIIDAAIMAVLGPDLQPVRRMRHHRARGTR